MPGANILGGTFEIVSSYYRLVKNTSPVFQSLWKVHVEAIIFFSPRAPEIEPDSHTCEMRVFTIQAVPFAQTVHGVERPTTNVKLLDTMGTHLAKPLDHSPWQLSCVPTVTKHIMMIVLT